MKNWPRLPNGGQINARQVTIDTVESVYTKKKKKMQNDE